MCVWDVASGRLDHAFQADAAAVSPDGQLLATRGQSDVRVHRLADGALDRTLLALRDQQYAAVSPDGHFAGSPDVEQEFVYVALTDDGEQITLTPAEFEQRFGWQNDPSQVPHLPGMEP